MENFVVSARKYRPATFASVVGQGHITSTLRNAIARQQLAHAYLFCGPRGVGKTTCARIFAKAINCLSPVDSEACGECESCRSFDEGRSFNIHELDAASNNSVDDIRNLTDQVRIPPQIGRYSVYIIDEVHMLSASAFNAFLKTLEEPPAHAIFILATTEKHKIIPTILSRCQIFDFNRIRVEDGAGYLRYIAEQEGITCDDESLHLMAQKADGGMRDALSMFDKAVAFCGNNLKLKDVAHTLNILDYDTYFTITDELGKGDYRAALVRFDEVLGKGFSGQFFVAGLASHFRDLLMCKDPRTLPLLEASGTLLERYKKQSEGWPPEILFDATALLASLDGALRTSSNQRLNIELGLLKLAGLGQKKNEGVKAAGETALGDGEVATGTESVLRDASLQPSPVHSPLPVDAVAPEGANGSPVFGAETDYPLPDIHAGKGDAATISGSPAGDSGLATGAESVPARVEADARPRLAGRSPQPGEVAASEQTAAPVPAPEESPAPPPAPDKPAGKKVSISGESLSAILSRKAAAAQPDAAQSGQTPADPAAQEKIEAVREQFLAQLNLDRPRIAMVFSSMTVSGNRIGVDVANESLHDEIVRSRTELLSSLASLAEVDGTIELTVNIKADTSARKPIKVEDKLQYLTQKNPLLDKLRRELELDIE